ncbi:inorganic phosphate transporter [Serinicoccus marinus]|uniref:inorganic phosphate transporter n=1 Tax=Serinicoccus marinus TaxID=247333 RepID=UPI0024934F72|nr:inorganic phosphate transporter [Serinicoccus marinus]
MTQVDFRPVEKATRSTAGEVGRIGVAVLFIVGVIVFTGAAFGHVEQAYLLIAAAVIGGYMALNIGANDVANNVGPAVGSMAMTMATAIGIAAVFEAAGAIIAGGDVVDTVKNGIIDPDSIGDPQIFVWVMLGSLLGAALWLNIATFMGAPVSTTHAIVGGVLGGGVASSGWAIVNWDVMGSIAMSWVISPLVGGLIAAGTLYLLKRTVLFRDEPVDAATRVVPLLIAVMAWAFTTYLALKGLSNLVSISFPVALFGGLVIAVITYAVVCPLVIRAAPGLTQDTEGVNSLFTIPLICAAALLSFAHGANDVANAVGPLAGIVEVLDGGAAGGEAGIPLWVLVIGAVGISVGLALFGPRLIRTVGSEITDLDRSRAFCIALAAAVTVIVASQLGLPVSSTHVALGGIFGVGFLREFLDDRMNRAIEKVLRAHRDDTDFAKVEGMLEAFREARPEDKRRMLDTLQEMGPEAVITAAQGKKLRKALKRQLVRRSHILKIASAWVITVPVAGLLSALFFFALRGMLLP